MRSLSLLVSLSLGKTYLFFTKGITIGAFSPFALIYQDVAFFLILMVLESRLSRGLTHILILPTALLSAASFPVMNVLSTPLTANMFSATGTTLMDSLVKYATAENIFGIVFILSPVIFFWRSKPLKMPLYSLLLIPIIALGGHFATKRAETLSLHLNPVLALIIQPDSQETHIDRDLLNSDSENFTQIKTRGYNLILIALESTGAQYLKTYGANKNPMPFLHHLVSQSSLIFDNAYAVYPESIKGLYSVICSEHPRIHSQASEYRNNECKSLAARLKVHGYQTHMLHSGRFHYLGMSDIVENRGFEKLEDASAIRGEKTSFGMISEFDAIEHLLSHIDQRDTSRPFFTHFLPVAGHHPYFSPPPHPFEGGRDIDNYHNALHHADSAIKVLVTGLKERGLYDKTLLVFYGDHAQAFGQHKGNYAHSLNIYEENIWVPLIIHAPGQIPSSTHVKKIVSLIDIAPTILDLFDYPVPKTFQGKSILKYTPAQVFFFTDYSLSILGLREGPWKYMIEEQTGRTRLYNLDEDREEKVNLSEKYPEKVERFQKLMRKWLSKKTTQKNYSK